ncbi:DUF4395 domain-containing protein [Leptospira meyeri]|uniref:Uncharacterized protein DUF4395 n=1 Tax=Leptospira meyeri TaxID=29508 RepID=A0A4V3HI30_LEPME|nr:DUF4395 domain-containing protein [Leptospira meyeri]EKJ87745.1 PF14340 domain protein [Leptospira meyeri serovar Hardjo str. Went 5]EMJ89351.1 PF14340 domain protein [Leptospira meyeri serovar Semaranga str. Veldrot Semarang 173]TDY68715.1 uncharacterized protein DUF4395 [Leptospira meyeri]
MKIGYYPDVVNENVTRIVASTVVFLGVTAILFPNAYVLGLLFIGFTLRLSYGPKFEPFAFFTSRYLVPWLGISFVGVAGPPKRFAQLVGFVFSLSAIIFFTLGYSFAYQITLATLVFFASLESFLGWCAGCFAFGLLMKLGIIPEEICERCNNLNFNK